MKNDYLKEKNNRENEYIEILKENKDLNKDII